mgnify:CR=1 FL=1
MLKRSKFSAEFKRGAVPGRCAALGHRSRRDPLLARAGGRRWRRDWRGYLRRVSPLRRADEALRPHRGSGGRACRGVAARINEPARLRADFMQTGRSIRRTKWDSI